MAAHKASARRELRVRAAVAATSLTLLITAVLLISQRMIASFRVEQLLTESRNALEAGKPDLAVELAESARNWRFNTSRAALARANALGGIDAIAAVNAFREQFRGSPESFEPPDLRAFLTLLLHSDEVQPYDLALQELLKLEPLAASTIAFKGWQSFRSNQITRAEELARIALREDPALSSANLLLGRILLRKSDNASKIAGKRALLLAANGRTPFAEEAASILRNEAAPLLVGNDTMELEKLAPDTE